MVDTAPYPDLQSYQIADPDRVASPGLLIFKHWLEHNLDEMVRVAGDAGRLRPHCKTHKTREITQMFLDRGVEAHKCATLMEAKMLAETGVADVLIAYQMVGPNLLRLVQLMEDHSQTKFSVLVDCPAAVNLLSKAMVGSKLSIDVLVDLNPGMDRTGIEPNAEAIQLYEMVASTAGIVPAGLHWYDGQHRQPDLQERKHAVENGWQRLTRFRDQLLLSGFAVPKVVAAGTGSFPILAELGEPDLQLSPGTTTFHDDDMLRRFPEQNFVPALAILTRVISKPRPGHLTLDVGHKACAADQPFGHRLFFPQLGPVDEVIHSEEHLVIQTDKAAEYSLGDTLLAFPRHACPVSAVHQRAHIIEDGKQVATWDIAARDRLLNP